MIILNYLNCTICHIHTWRIMFLNSQWALCVCRSLQYMENMQYLKYNTIQYNTILYNTIQYNTIQFKHYSTLQYNKIKYKKTQEVLLLFPNCTPCRPDLLQTTCFKLITQIYLPITLIYSNDQPALYLSLHETSDQLTNGQFCPLKISFDKSSYLAKR